MQHSETPLDEPSVRTIAMPAHTNSAGDIFGGWLMWQMDPAAGNAAARRARGRYATVAVDSMVFHRPVAVGDEVSLYATVSKVGRTSLTVSVEAWRRRGDEAPMMKVTEARLRLSPLTRTAGRVRFRTKCIRRQTTCRVTAKPCALGAAVEMLRPDKRDGRAGWGVSSRASVERRPESELLHAVTQRRSSPRQ